MRGKKNKFADTLSNVFDKRVGQISEPATFYYPTITIPNCKTTTLRTNYNYIRSS